MPVPEYEICPRCKCETHWRGSIIEGKREVASVPCYACSRELGAIAENLRAVYEKAYFAKATSAVHRGICHDFAMDTVRHWAEMKAELEKEISRESSR